MRWKHAIPSVVFGIMASLVFGCGGSSAPSDQPKEVLVFAASSLTDAFGQLEMGYEAIHPEIDVVLSFGGSSALREQIVEGAPVGAFASASVSIMNQVVEAGANSGNPEVFATNKLEIVVPAGNPGGVGSLEDFSNEHLLIGLCNKGVPCGDFGREALSAAGVSPSVDTLEPDVRSLLTKVAAGELDAGIVYVTDVMAGGDQVQGIKIPDEFNVVATYPITVLKAAPNPDAARAFFDFVLSSDGRRVLESFGFGPP